MQIVIPTKLVSSLTHTNYDDKFMSYIYSSDFKLQIEILAVLNHIQSYYIVFYKDNSM